MTVISMTTAASNDDRLSMGAEAHDGKPQGQAAKSILSLAEVRAAPVVKEPPPPPDTKPVSILRVTGCRYAVTDDKPHQFCNAPMKDGSSYCEHHHAKCYDGLPRAGKRTRRDVPPFAMRARG